VVKVLQTQCIKNRFLLRVNHILRTMTQSYKENFRVNLLYAEIKYSHWLEKVM